MSFLGAIGCIMSDSGIHELLSVIYAEKAVSHMLSGKGISRTWLTENYKEAEYITEQVSGNQVERSEKVEQTAEEVDQISQKTREIK